MKLLDDLQSEHRLIERMAATLQAVAAGRASGEAPPADGAAAMRFFRLYAGRFHHAREEEVLFPALVATEVPGDRGPLAALLHAHHAMAHLLDQLEPLIGAPAPSREEAERAAALARRYGEALLHHIDAENSVLFPESVIRFRRQGLSELPGRGPDAEEEAARREGERLVARYPREGIPGVFRGEGCVACADYGTRCDGVEREWWSEHEWEDALERMGNG